MKNYGDRGGCFPSRPRRITPSEIFIILHMIRKPNSVIVLLFIQNNSQFKNIASSIVHVQGCSAPQIFSKQQMSPFELCSCCSCHVFSYNFVQFLLLKRVKCPPFLFSQPKQLNLVPRPGLLEAWLVLTSVKYHGNLYILIPLNQRLALTRLRATGPRSSRLTVH